jgi:hypothetical protein
VTKMAEVALVASIIAIFQIADRLIGLCKVYIKTVHNAPSDFEGDTTSFALAEPRGFTYHKPNQSIERVPAFSFPRQIPNFKSQPNE